MENLHIVSGMGRPKHPYVLDDMLSIWFAVHHSISVFSLQSNLNLYIYIYMTGFNWKKTFNIHVLRDQIL